LNINASSLVGAVPKMLASAIGILALSACLIAAYWSIRFAAADELFRENNLDSLRKAVVLAPGNASYRALLAEHMEGLGDNPQVQLLAAADLSPLESHYWIRLAAWTEEQHDYVKAEQYLLRAAQVDRKFDPRWALMNFYFRRGRTAEFWLWLTRTLDYSYGDPSPIFQLAWETTQDDNEIQRHLPSKPNVLTAYLAYLVVNGRLQESVPIARRIAGFTEYGDDPNLLLAWWEQIYQRHSRDALEVWNILCKHRVIPYLSLRPANGEIVTNADFSITPVSKGFDWRLPAADGLTVVPDGSSGELVVHMSGKEPEDVVLAQELIPLERGRKYQIGWDYRSPAGDAVSGLSWSVMSVENPSAVIARPAGFNPAANWKSGTLDFDAGQNEMALLRLRYTRPSGAVRAEGTAMIRKITGQIDK
jgi:hypothetical protein